MGTIPVCGPCLSLCSHFLQDTHMTHTESSTVSITYASHKHSFWWNQAGWNSFWHTSENWFEWHFLSSKLISDKTGLGGTLFRKPWPNGPRERYPKSVRVPAQFHEKRLSILAELTRVRLDNSFGTRMTKCHQG